jgi:hypothetical protein
MTGVASGAANAYTSVALFFSEIRVTQSLVFCVLLCRLFVVLFLLVTVLSANLPFPAFDYHFWYLQTFFFT